MISSRDARRLGPRISASLLALILGGCAGTMHHSDGLRLLAADKPDEGIAELREATRSEPDNKQFEIDLLDHQTAAADKLVRMGDQARSESDMSRARALYERAAKIDPGNARAARGLSALLSFEQHARTLDEAAAMLKAGQLDQAQAWLKSVLIAEPSNARAAELSRALAEARDKAERQRSQQQAAQSSLRKPVTLQFRDAPLRMVFEAIARTTGLNVVFDRDVRSDLKATLFVKDVPVEDTVDLILMQNQLGRRTLSANTIFVYPATPAKQKEYEDLQVRTFRVTNGDPKYLQGLLKNVLKLKEVSVEEKTGLLVVRDTPEAVAVAAKVIAAHDMPDPEVMLEVRVLEVSTDRESDLGIEFPQSLTVSTPGASTNPDGSPSGGSLLLGQLKTLGLKNLLVSPLSATANLKLEDTDAKLLASPRIRARNREKAKILIGDRVPTIVNTVTPVQTGTPVITGTVQYQDVGLKLEFEPLVYSDNDVGIKIGLEVSSIVKEFTDAQGGRSYQIGTRNAETALRLHDGETQVLGGLITDNDRNAASKIPGLGHLPLIGRLFGNNSGSTAKSEIVLSITPHIIRGVSAEDAAVTDVFSGTESNLRDRPLRLDSIGAANAVVVPSSPTSSNPTPGPGPVPAGEAPRPASGAAAVQPTSTPAVVAPLPEPVDGRPVQAGVPSVKVEPIRSTAPRGDSAQYKKADAPAAGINPP